MTPAHQPAPLLSVKALTVRLPHGAERPFAVEAADLTVTHGAFVALVGRSGSGKSMLAQTIAGFTHADPRFAVGGSVELAGTSILSCSAEALRRVRTRHLGFVFQDPFAALNPTSRLRDQFRAVFRTAGARARARREEALGAVLDDVGLPDTAAFLARYPHEISGGQCQRVVIAMMLLQRPDLLILDEPTTALDSVTSFGLLRTVQRLIQRERLAVLYVSHDLRLVADNADTMLVMEEGRIVDRGPPEYIFCNSSVAITRKFRRHTIDPPPSAPWEPAAATPPVLSVEGLSLTYRVPRVLGLTRESVPVLKDIGLALHPGECVGLIGRSGSGKSTLARCLAGLVAPDAGTIRLAAAPRRTPAHTAGSRRIGRVQMIFQDSAATLHPYRKLFAIFWESLRKLGHDRGSARAACAAMLERVGLPATALDRTADSFSGGQCQRLAIARALLLRPEVIVADEPTAALDVVTRNEVLDLFARLVREDGIALLFISHDLRAALRLCSRFLVIDDGRLTDNVPRSALHRAESHSPHLAALLQAAGLAADGFAAGVSGGRQSA